MNWPTGTNEVDPADIVDREAEAKRFADLLDLGTQRRILAVSDNCGWGKSTFLRKLRHLCDYQYRIPVALVPLEDYDDRPDEFELVSDMATQLKEAGVPFDSFDTLNRLRSFHDGGMFLDGLRGAVNAAGASVTGGQVAGTIFNIQHADNVGAPDWSDEADRQAKGLCLQAFLAELFEAASKQKVVIIFDNVEHATQQLRRWVLKTLVTDRILAQSDSQRKLIVVMAGEKLEPTLTKLFADLACFDLIPAFGTWGPADTARLFEVHGLNGLQPHLVTQLHGNIVAREVSLTGALSIARIYHSEAM
jgi:hypothetical protein